MTLIWCLVIAGFLQYARTKKISKETAQKIVNRIRERGLTVLEQLSM